MASTLFFKKVRDHAHVQGRDQCLPIRVQVRIVAVADGLFICGHGGANGGLLRVALAQQLFSVLGNKKSPGTRPGRVNMYAVMQLKPYRPCESPPRRLIPPQLHPGLQRPARQRSQDTHGHATLCRHADCGPASADEGDDDFGAAKSRTRGMMSSPLNRSS